MFIISTVNSTPRFDWHPVSTTWPYSLRPWKKRWRPSARLHGFKTQRTRNRHVQWLRHPYTSPLQQNMSVQAQSRWVTCSPRCESLWNCGSAGCCRHSSPFNRNWETVLSFEARESPTVSSVLTSRFCTHSVLTLFVSFCPPPPHKKKKKKTKEISSNSVNRFVTLTETKYPYFLYGWNQSLKYKLGGL
jgi:hypothetical protein